MKLIVSSSFNKCTCGSGFCVILTDLLDLHSSFSYLDKFVMFDLKFSHPLRISTARELVYPTFMISGALYLCFVILTMNSIRQGGGKRLPNYHLVGENCFLVVENLFGLPNLVGLNFLLKIYVA